MTRKCFVKTCPSNTKQKFGESKLSFHFFPKNPEQKELWLKNINAATNIVHSEPQLRNVICDLHFENPVQQQRGQRGQRLSFDAVPTIFANENKFEKKLAPQHHAPKIQLPTVIKIETILVPGQPCNSTTANIMYQENVEQSSTNSADDLSIINESTTTTKEKIRLKRPSELPLPSTKRKRMVFPGDIRIENLSPSAAKSIEICRKKIAAQAKIILKLKRSRKRQQQKINKQANLLKELKQKISLSEGVEQSIVVINDFVSKVKTMLE